MKFLLGLDCFDRLGFVFFSLAPSNFFKNKFPLYSSLNYSIVYVNIEVINIINTYLFVINITTVIHWFIYENTGHFWRLEKFENMPNPDFENI